MALSNDRIAVIDVVEEEPSFCDSGADRGQGLGIVIAAEPDIIGVQGGKDAIFYVAIMLGIEGGETGKIDEHPVFLCLFRGIVVHGGNMGYLSNRDKGRGALWSEQGKAFAGGEFKRVPGSGIDQSGQSDRGSCGFGAGVKGIAAGVLRPRLC